MVTVQLIGVFFFSICNKNRFSHDMAQFSPDIRKLVFKYVKNSCHGRHYKIALGQANIYLSKQPNLLVQRPLKDDIRLFFETTLDVGHFSINSFV